jgi:hypothetical protein
MSDGKQLPSLPSAPAPSPAFAAPLPRTALQRKMRKPPPKVRAAIYAYVFRGKTKTAAAKIAGISREYFERSLSLPHVAEYLRVRAASKVASSAGRAAARLDELIDSRSERVAFEATRFSLGVAGIKPAEDARLSVSVELKAGYVIDLSEPGSPAAKIVGGQAIDAKSASE